MENIKPDEINQQNIRIFSEWTDVNLMFMKSGLHNRSITCSSLWTWSKCNSPDNLIIVHSII